MQRSEYWVSGVVLALALAGCGSPLSLLPLALLLLGLTLATACRGSETECCRNGKISTCTCPANTYCNYGDFLDCGDGTCTLGGAAQCGDGGPDIDTGVPDAGADAGRFGPCCMNGRVTTCFCPAQVACNYGWFTNCGDGTCSNVFPADAAAVCPVDAGRSDAALGFDAAFP